MKTSFAYLMVMFLWLSGGTIAAQTAIPNTTPVTQNFDGMGTGANLPSNWRIGQSSASPTWTTGVLTVTQTATSSSTSATGGTYNWQSASPATNRVVLAMSSGSFASPSSVMGYFRNTSANAITALAVSYNGKRFRRNSAAAQINFYYSTNGTSWTAVPAGDIATSSFPTGASTYGYPLTTVPVSFNITGLNIAANGDIYLRWNLNTTGTNSQCIGVDDVSVTATFAASTITTGTVSAPLCAGGIVAVPFTYSVAAAFSGSTFTAQLSNSSGNFAIPTTLQTTVSNTSGSQSINVTIPASTPTGAGYRIRVVSNSPAVNGADNGSNLDIRNTVTSVAPAAAQSISVSTNGAALTVTENSAVNGREWKYSTTPGGPYTMGTGITADSYTPNFSSTGTYYVVCESTYGTPCNSTVTSNEVQIDVSSSANTIATGAVTGSSFCSGTTGVNVPFTYNPAANFTSGTCTFAAQLSDASGNFSSPVALQSVVSDASGSQSINVTIPPGTVTGTGYRIRIVSDVPAVNGADNGTDLSISPIAAPAPISGATSVCVASSGNEYSVPSTPGYTYTWSVTGAGWSIPVSSTTNSVTVTSGPGAGTVNVFATSGTCNSGTTSLNVNISGAPSQPSIISQSPSGTPCTGSTFTYSVSNVPGTTYAWVAPAGWVINSGQGTNSISITPPVGTGLGTFTVTPSNGCGTGTARTLNITSIQAGISITQAPADVTVCGDNTATLSVTASSATSRQWQYFDGSQWQNHTENLSGISGSTSNTLIIANPYSNKWSGVQQRVVLSNTGANCTVYNLPATVTATALPSITLPGTLATIYSENFGAIATNVARGAALPTGWTTTGTDVWSLSSQSTSSGSAGDANVISPQYGTFPNPSSLVSPSINTTGHNNILVSYSARGTADFLGSVVLQYSANGGTTWTTVPYQNIPYNTNWIAINNGVSIQLPADASDIPNLKLRWLAHIQANASNYRIDNVVVRGVANTNLNATICNSLTSFSFPYSGTTGTPDRYSVTSGTPAMPGFLAVTDAALGVGSINVAIPANTPAGDYQFKVSVKRNSTGCSSFAEQLVLVRVKETPDLTSLLADHACTGIINDYAAISDAPSTSFNWSRGAVANISPATGSGTGPAFGETLLNGTASPIDVTYVVAMSSNGCSNTQQVIVTVNPLPLVSVAVTENSGAGINDGTICSGDTALLTVSPSAGMLYSWSNALGTVSAVSASPLLTTVYMVTVTDDVSGCSNTATGTVNVIQSPVLNAANTGAYGVGQNIQLNASGPGAGISYAWIGPGLFASGIQNPTVLNATLADAGAYVVTATDPVTQCYSTDSTIVEVYSAAEWTGAADSNWANAANWSPNVVPNSCGINITIQGATFQPAISGTSVTVGNVSIASGVKLTLHGQDMNVCGSWTGGSGTNASVIGNGTVYINGSQVQTLNGTTRFEVLQVNNANGVVLSNGAAISITRGLHLQHGTLDVTAGTLHLLSTTTSYGYIDDFTPGFDGEIAGNTTVERYIPVQGYNQHFISSPVSNPALSQVNASGPDGAYIIPDANCDETRSSYGSPYGSVFIYNDGHAAPGNCMLGNWMVKSQGNMQNGRGYSAYLTGGAFATLTGTANTGNIAISGLNNSGYPTVNTLQGQPIESGWNLVGNPYPSAIDMTISRVGDGFQNQVQVWETSGPFAGSWQSATITGAPGAVIIPPFQGFMVRRVGAGTGAYSFYQTERSRIANASFYRSAMESSLSLVVDYNGVKDKTRIEFNAGATLAFDDEFDANKPNGSAGRPTLYTHMNTNKWYSINTLPSLTQSCSVYMGLRPEVSGSMTLSADGIATFDPTTYILLEDKKTGKWHNLRSGDYTFTTSKTDEPNRFVLHFTPPVQIAITDATCQTEGRIEISQAGNTVWNYTLTDMSGNPVEAGVLGAATPFNLYTATGAYRFNLTDSLGYTVAKTIQVNGAQPVSAHIDMAKTTALVGEEIVFESSTTVASDYNWSFGDGNMANGRQVSHRYSTEGVFELKLTVTSQHGCVAEAVQKINITPDMATGIIGDIYDNDIRVWSIDGYLFVDFTNQRQVNARVELYNAIGQLMSTDWFGHADIYQKQLPAIPASYIIVRVQNGSELVTRRILPGNK